MRIRQNIKRVLRKGRQSIRIPASLYLRHKVQRWGRRVVFVISDTERLIFDLTFFANDAIITHMKAHDYHGNNAEIGDLVKIYSTTGFDTGIVGIVIEVREFTSWTMETTKRIKIDNNNQIWDAHLARIISKAEINGRD